MELIAPVFLSLFLVFLQACEKGTFGKKVQVSQVATQDKVSDVSAESHGNGVTSSTPESEVIKPEVVVAKEHKDVSESALETPSKDAVAKEPRVAIDQIANELPKTLKSDKSESIELADKKPAFLAKDCGLANEGEMGYYPAKKQAFYCDGSKWVKLPKSAFSGKSKKVKFTWDVVNDKSFLCQKSPEGGFRCMKAETYKQAH